MMPEVSIYYLMAIFRVFLLIIGQKQNFSVIASTKNGIDMKCHDSLKPLCVRWWCKPSVRHFTMAFLKKWVDIKWNQCVDNEINSAELKFLPGWPTLFLKW